MPVNKTIVHTQWRRISSQVAAAVLLAVLAGCGSSEKPIDPWTRDKDAVLSAIKSNQKQDTAFGQQIQELTRQILKLQKEDKQRTSQIAAIDASLKALREKQGELIIGHKKRLEKEKKPTKKTASKNDKSATALAPSLQEKLANIEQDLDRTLKQTAVKSSLSIDDPQPKAEPTSQPTPEPVAVKTIDPTAEKNSYSAAYLSLKSGRFEDAGNKFLAHLKKFPRGSLTDQALYWLGESYLAQQREKEALKALQQLVRDYPRSGKYGAALLRIASLYENKNRKGDAKAAYLQLIQTQPNSTAAERARARLTDLK